MIKRALAHAAERHEEFVDRARKDSPRSRAQLALALAIREFRYLPLDRRSSRAKRSPVRQREGWRAAN
jgi:hypothetical protein